MLEGVEATTMPPVYNAFTSKKCGPFLSAANVASVFVAPTICVAPPGRSTTW